MTRWPLELTSLPGRVTASLSRSTPPVVTYAPILDSARGVTAGFSTRASSGTGCDAAELTRALSQRADLPRNTFLSVPLEWSSLNHPSIRGALLRYTDLRGVTFELVGVAPSGGSAVMTQVVQSIQEVGGLIAVAASEIWHCAFATITIPPAMVVIGAQWVRDIQDSHRMQAMVQALGSVASDRDTWVVATDVVTAGELRVLVDLGVPLIRGPIVGDIATAWPILNRDLVAILGAQRPRTPGPLRVILRPAASARSLDRATELAQVYEHVVVVDLSGRPTGLVSRIANHVERQEDVLTINVDTPIRDAAARAVARPEPARAAPVAITDNAGRLLGLVLVAELTRFAYDHRQTSTNWTTIVD